ncbi:MAG: YciI family protein [Thermoleophilia bacterium]|nr:YciI family protein [Thermoleophilia bacterium]
MKYMLLIYSAECDWTEDERRACMIESLGLCRQLAARGKLVDASPLEPVAAAATVRVRDGRVLVTEGPFAETTEQLGGYYILDLADLDEAIAVAAQLPPASKGTVEIRPLAPLDGLPTPRLRPNPGPEADATLRPFLLICYDDEGAWKAAGPEALAAAQAEAAGIARELAASGRYIDASPLHTSETATSVRVRGGRRMLTDGPFAETNEVLGGYYLIGAVDREDALAVAARHPGARSGAVEVRPLFDVSALVPFAEKS